MHLPLKLFLATLLLSPGLVSAEKSLPFVDEYDHTVREDLEDPEEWKESRAKIPPYPSQDDLVEFNVDLPGTPFRYFIDKASLSVAKDGIIRYTLVIESGSGAQNVSYEGMQCNESQYKVYAYGVGNLLKPVGNPKWVSLLADGYNRYHQDLYHFYLCDHGPQTAYSPKEVIRRMGQGTPSKNVDLY